MKISEDELYQVASMHISLLKDGFLAGLGHEFLFNLQRNLCQ